MGSQGQFRQFTPWESCATAIVASPECHASAGDEALQGN